MFPHYNGKNKTFFNGIYDPYKQAQSVTYTADVYTQSARREFSGIIQAF